MYMNNLLFTVSLPAETAATRRFNGVVSVEVSLDKDRHLATNAVDQQGTERSRLQLQSEAQHQDTGEECALDLLSAPEEKLEEKPEDGFVEDNNRLGEKDRCENSEPDVCLSQALNN